MADTKYLTVPHLDTKTLARIFSKIAVDRAIGCWVWTGARTWSTHGVVYFNGRQESIHRLMYAWLVEPLPRHGIQADAVVDHIKCDNPPCCNPAHLRLGTTFDNLARTGSVSAVNRRKTHCINGHELPTTPNRWNGYGRTCVICSNKRQREAKRRKYAERRAMRQGVPPCAAEVETPNQKASQG